MVNILTICTGNICRSPFAERYLQRGFDEIAPGAFTISSAGTGALVGRAMDERSAQRLADAGGDPEGFVSRQLTEALLGQADFVLALTAAHRARVVELSPRMLKRAFTVREFSRVLAAVAADDGGGRLPRGEEKIEERWKALPNLAALKRHGVRPADPGEDDVVDPFKREDIVYDRMVVELLPALRGILEFEAASRS
ncbi:low molecular weight phosphatase family protein [Arthrobacter ginkgonis]|uniref:Low molecular weight phosphatase family protein n=1 Tax=Arthrobacter ginkgonis TaxID=1630594 RepID=A0ABP7CPX0_9MICC